MQTLENQCKEMVDNIEDSTCTVLFFRSQIGCLYSWTKDICYFISFIDVISIAQNYAGINIVQEKADEARRKQTDIIDKGKIIANDKEHIEHLIVEASEQLKQAKLSLAEFDRSTIIELLEMDAPPECVQIIGACFLILNGVRDSCWKNVQDMMNSDDNFRKLLNINYHAITVSQLSQCKSHLKVSQYFFRRRCWRLCMANYFLDWEFIAILHS